MGKLLITAQEAMLAGAGPVKRLYERSISRLGAKYKGNATPQTLIDTEAEKAILKVIRHSPFSQDTIRAEESGHSAGKNGRTWYIDPFDGTANIAIRIPESTMALSIRDRGEMAVAVVLHPFEMEMIYAERGEGAWKVPLAMEGRRMVMAGKPSPLKPRETPENPHARYIWIDGHWNDKNALRKSAWLSEVHTLAMNTRECGSDVDKPGKVASGRGDMIFVDAVGEFHDLGPGIVIMREAGGLYTDMFGREPQPEPLTQLVVGAMDPELHARLMELSRKHYGPDSPLGPYKGFLSKD